MNRPIRLSLSNTFLEIRVDKSFLSIRVLQLLLLLALSVFSLEPTTAQIVRADTTFANYLMALAWENSPKRTTANSQLRIAELEEKKAKRGYFDVVTPFMNFGLSNEDPIIDSMGNPVPAGNSGINMGMSLRISSLFTTPVEVKQARELQQIEQSQRQLEEQQLKAEFLARYEKYLFYQELLRLRMRAEEDAETNYELIGELFRKQGAEFDEYNTASRTYEEAVEKRLQAASEVRLAKILVEELITMSLEEARRRYFANE